MLAHSPLILVILYKRWHFIVCQAVDGVVNNLLMNLKRASIEETSERFYEGIRPPPFLGLR